jgi:RsiW-degrading membrane proteinase PrsW (M82 family)
MLRYLPEASCALAVFAAAALPVGNTLISFLLAPAAVVLGVLAFFLARPRTESIQFKCVMVGLVLGAVITLGLVLVHYLANSAAAGKPL